MCDDWFAGYTITNAMIYASALAIVIFNAIILEILIRKDLLYSYSSFTKYNL